MVAYSFKKRFIDPIRCGLDGIARPLILPVQIRNDLPPSNKVAICIPKTQTIRAEGKRRHARIGETLQLYTAMRTKQCALIGLAICKSVESIELLLKSHSFRVAIEGFPLKSKHIDEFIREDGFQDAQDMLNFWRTEHPGIDHFKGFLIKWEPKPYSAEDADVRPGKSRKQKMEKSK